MNDYNTECGGVKQDGFYAEVKSLLDRGVPIGAVSLQCHIASPVPRSTTSATPSASSPP
jgi:GH35 family endo-1,4-beta-xylanase